MVPGWVFVCLWVCVQNREGIGQKLEVKVNRPLAASHTLFGLPPLSAPLGYMLSSQIGGSGNLCLKQTSM